MSNLWQNVKGEIGKQISEVRPFIAYAGARSAGKIKLHRITESSADDELHGMLLPFAPAVGDESVWIMVGGKPFCLGKSSRVAGPAIYMYAGSPEGNVTAEPGSICLRSSGMAAGTVIYEKVSGSGNTGWVANAATDTVGIGPPMIMRFPFGLDYAATTTSLVSNTSYAYYMGVAAAAYTSVSIRTQVDTGAGTITWAEIGVGTSPAIGVTNNASITRRGYTDVSAVVNSTGDKTITVTVSGIAAGDHLWALFGSQASTPAQYQSTEPDYWTTGLVQSSAATRISTMSSPTSFSAVTSLAASGHWSAS